MLRVISYRCRHCQITVGVLPSTAKREVIGFIQNIAPHSEEQFLQVTDTGGLEVRCICEQCEHTLNLYPYYYTLEKWLQ